MKQLLILTITLLLLSGSCRKNRQANPIDQLPPETTTGTNTFGCLVNEKIFKPGGAQLSGGSLQCNYQLVNGRFYFVLSGRNQTGSNVLTSVSLYTDSIAISENMKFFLKSRKNGNPSGRYFGSESDLSLATYLTNDNIYSGELWIKKLDPINQIVSGTFWFDAVNANGQKVEIRDGRFDVRYKQ